MSTEIYEEMQNRIQYRLKEIENIMEEYIEYNKERQETSKNYHGKFSRIHRQYRAIAQSILNCLPGMGQFDGMSTRSEWTPVSFRVLEKRGLGSIGKNEGGHILISSDEEQKKTVWKMIKLLGELRPDRKSDKKDKHLDYLDFVAGIFFREIEEVLIEDTQFWGEECYFRQKESVDNFYKAMENEEIE